MSSPMDEDELLRSPEEVEKEEQPTDERVSDATSSYIDKMTTKLLGQVSTIAVVCDSELSKTMRTDDPRRDSISALVAEQTALVKELVRVSMAELRDFCKSKPDPRTAILNRACINDANALTKFMQNHETMKRTVTLASKNLQCDEESVNVAVQKVLRELEQEKKLTQELEDDLQKCQLQLEQLRQEVENMGRSGQAIETVPSSGADLRTDDLDRIPPEILKEYANRRLKEQSKNRTIIGHRQLANWRGSYSLTEALELSKPTEAYEKVKEVALRLERSLRVAEECRITNSQHRVDRKASLQQKPSRTIPYSQQRMPARKELSKKGITEDEVGRQNLPSQGSTDFNRTTQEKRRCHNCGAIGHLARDCRKLPPPNQRKEEVTPQQQNMERPQTGTYASLVEKWACATEGAGTSISSDLFGKKSLETITIFGITAVALLDTGSQTTIIPLQLLQKAIGQRVNLDKYIERIPSPKVSVRDASGNDMRFFDTIR
ncbi:zinc knuckle, partial [Oesophagostomum dentatum]